MTRRLLPLLCAAGLVLAACSDDESTDDTAPPAAETTQPATTAATAPASTEPPSVETTSPAPTTEPEPTVPETTEPDRSGAATAYVERGPYPVGVTTLQLDKGPLVEVWYPAVEGTTGTTGYDTRDYVPQAVRDLLTSDLPAGYEYEGARDVAVAEGSFPVVLFSHGFSGFRAQSSFLTSHLASHGMVVVAPDHPSRDLNNVLSGTASGDRADAVDDLLQSLDLIVAEGAAPGSRFEGRVDDERVAALGHSAGGGTILGAALDPRVDGYVSMASGAPAEGATWPTTPSFFLAGAIDGVVSASERTRPAFEAAPSPTRYWEIEATGHNGFTDFCTFGGGTGIIGVAEASGLGPLLDAQPQFRSIGADGCLPPAAPIDQVIPIVRHGVTSWLRSLFGEDAEPVGLGPEVDGAYEVGIVVDER